VEATSHCIRHCLYCGLRAPSEGLDRYRMEASDIHACALEAHRLGYGSVVIQGGEDPGLTQELVTSVIQAIKRDTPLAITLSLGERSDDDLQAWREAGADRYLLRFETSDPVLYRRIHPNLPGVPSDRFAQLERMRRMGYEIGTGVMVGIPGQTFDTLAGDILRFRDFDMDMIGVGPFLPSPRTPLGGPGAEALMAPPGEQVPNDELTTLKTVALTRLVCPDANIPSTTALATLNRARGRELALMCGANVVMPNVTPVTYRERYEIYPGKACVNETAAACQGCMEGRIRSLGRRIGRGPGGRRRTHCKNEDSCDVHH
jgi:biotin synthase